jgi:hypothetical protein
MQSKQGRQWRGSVCAGVLTSRWPFGKMVARSDQIELNSLLGNFVLPKGEVHSVQRAGFFPWMGMGLRIRHAHDGYPDRLMFAPFLFWRRGRIFEHLRSLGYQVA